MTTMAFAYSFNMYEMPLEFQVYCQMSIERFIKHNFTDSL